MQDVGWARSVQNNSRVLLEWSGTFTARCLLSHIGGSSRGDIIESLDKLPASRFEAAMDFIKRAK
jgi:hypothetical protein